MEISRRVFVKGAGVFTAVRLLGAETAEAVVRFGMVTDIHYGDLADREGHWRYFRESRRKLDEAVAVFNTRGLDFAIELGDFKDKSPTKEATLACLDEIERSFTAFNGPCHHLPGNHDFDCLTPEEFYGRLRNAGEPMTRGYHAFDVKGIRFIALDGCYDSRMRHYSRNNPWTDANIPPEEMAWLERQLAEAPGPAVVFCHQRLDPFTDARGTLRNAAAVRAVLERSGKVKAVVTGHHHHGGFSEINGITYYTLRAIVCGTGEGANAFAEGAVAADGSLSVTGWRWAAPCRAACEAPERGTAVDGAYKPGAALVCLTGNLPPAELRRRIAACPKTGVRVCVRAGADDAARAAAEALRETGFLARGVVMCASPEAVKMLGAACPWVRTGLAPAALDDAVIRYASSHNIALLELPRGARCTPEQTAVLHDWAVATIGAPGSDFIRT